MLHVNCYLSDLDLTHNFTIRVSCLINNSMDFLNKLQTKLNKQISELEEKSSDFIQTLKIKCEPEIRAQRWETCQGCEHLTAMNRCRKCGCFMELKTWMPEQECPLQKWRKVSEI